ncbi:MAG: nucleotidyltransferase domain-containing protein [Candidatus Thorarchaeota archaeon]|jgi:predicted nucleotidyltransferase
MTKRPETLHETREVLYNDDHWSLLRSLREKAQETMQRLDGAGMRSFAYGSIARGDIHKSSDIDVIVPYPVSSYRIEVSLGRGIHRELVQATPSTVIKGHIHLDNDLVVTFPLFKLMPREEEFYRWGGQVDLDQIRDEVRVPGVDKRLVLIEPTETGHEERGVIGYEHEVAKRIGVGIAIAQERVRVLKRREDVGRTGVYLTRPLSEDESFETVAKSLKDSDPAIRRTIGRRET